MSLQRRENFKEEEVQSWNARGKAEAGIYLKWSLGESFFHGLNLVNTLEGENSKLEKSLKNSRDSVTYYKGQLTELQKKLAEDDLSHKADKKHLQNALDEAAEIAKKQGEANALAFQKLQDELADLEGNTLKAQSDTYNAGFFAYLTNFIAADPEYDLSKNFAPSTPGYMLKFKADNAQGIEEARLKLDAKIRGEMEKKAQEPNKGDPADASGTSHSNTLLA